MRKRKWQTNGKTDGMETRKIVEFIYNDERTQQMDTQSMKQKRKYTRNYWKNL
jgi:hypothetical protein